MSTPQETQSPASQPNQYLPESFRNYIEQNYYQRVTEQAVLEYIIHSEAFLKDPIKHIALYSDHGVVHVRDVAKEIILVIDRINGILIPKREKQTLDFMYGYGTAVAYLHDIGMRDFSDFGRFMHPEFAAQAIFTKEFDRFVDLLWEENSGNMAWRILSLSSQQLLKQSPKDVLRELLSLSVCHSKSKMPVDILSNPHQLRERMTHILDNQLHYLYLKQQLNKAQKGLTQVVDKEDPVHNPVKARERYDEVIAALQKYEKTTKPEDRINDKIQGYYEDFSEESFQWLISEEPLVKEMVYDVIDTLRALRCADALRQRGTTYRTSAGYEVFVDQRTANAIYALRNRDNSQLFLYEAKKPMNAGEANLASSELDVNCDLRLSFHRGAFASKKATKKAAYNAAILINDIQADVIVSFKHIQDARSKKSNEGIKKEGDIKILIEGVNDNPDFASLVCEKLAEINAKLGERAKPVVSLQDADLHEVNRYLRGALLVDQHTHKSELKEILDNISDSGHEVSKIDLIAAFEEVKIIHVKAGDILIRSGSPSGFVYIPYNEGLRVIPMGGYTSVPAKAWVPIGNTGVIRGSIRNANVVAEDVVKLLMIPRQVYLQHWYHTYNSKKLSSALRALRKKMTENLTPAHLAPSLKEEEVEESNVS